jgi:hypothetical protein
LTPPLAAGRTQCSSMPWMRRSPRVVVAVGVPADGAVGVGDEVAARRRRARRDGDAGDAVFVGQPVGVEPQQAQLRAQRARQALSSAVTGLRYSAMLKRAMVASRAAARPV